MNTLIYVFIIVSKINSAVGAAQRNSFPKQMKISTFYLRGFWKFFSFI